MRSVPLRIPPRDGELLYSWLERTAARYGLPLHKLHPTLRGRQPTLMRRLGSDIPEELAAYAGMTPERLRRLTHNPADLASNDDGGPRPLCPACMDETDGAIVRGDATRPAVVCVRHRLFLVDCCPACGGPPGWPAKNHWRAVPRPQVCSRRADGCQQELAGLPRRAAPQAVVAVQRTLDSPNSVEGRTQQRELEDLANLVGRYSMPQDFIDLPDDMVWEFTAARRKADWTPPRGRFGRAGIWSPHTATHVPRPRRRLVAEGVALAHADRIRSGDRPTRITEFQRLLSRSLGPLPIHSHTGDLSVARYSPTPGILAELHRWLPEPLHIPEWLPMHLVGHLGDLVDTTVPEEIIRPVLSAMLVGLSPISRRADPRVQAQRCQLFSQYVAAAHADWGAWRTGLLQICLDLRGRVNYGLLRNSFRPSHTSVRARSMSAYGEVRSLAFQAAAWAFHVEGDPRTSPYWPRLHTLSPTQAQRLTEDFLHELRKHPPTPQDLVDP